MTERIAASLRRLALSEDNRRWWTLGAMCFALFMIMLDNTVVNVALPSIQTRPRRVAGRAGLDGQRLHPDLRRPAGHRRAPGRHLRTAAHVPLRGRGVRAVQRDRSACSVRPAPADRLARHPGRGRRVHDARHAFDRLRARSRRTSEARALGTWAGVSALALAIGPVVGGLPDRDVSWRAIFFLNLPVAAGALAVTLFAVRESRDETVSRHIDLRRHGGAHRRPGRAGAGAGGGQRLGLGIGARARTAGRRGGRRWSRSWSSSGACAVPMVDFAFFRSRTFLGASLVGVHRLLRDAGDVLLPGPVHAERAGLLAAGGRGALPALHAGGDRRWARWPAA